MPDWGNSARFDVSARKDPTPSPEQRRECLQALLAERFKLSVHTETRQLPIYALRMARSDGGLSALNFILHRPTVTAHVRPVVAA